MSRRPWERLVRELRDEGYQSPYLDRLRQRLDPAEAQEQLEKEIVREMASALGRAEEKVLVALLELELAGRALDSARDERDRRSLAERFDGLRTRALAARHHLLIHREAVGIRRNQILETLYPVPPPRSAPPKPAVLIRVVVKLRADRDLPQGGRIDRLERDSRIAALRECLLASLPADQARVTRRFTSLPYVALEVSPLCLAVLRSSPLVESVELDRLEGVQPADTPGGATGQGGARR